MTRIDICNNALSQLGRDSISSWDDESATARQIKVFYETSVDRLLREHNWNFAMATAKLVETKNKGIADYPVPCAVPLDCSRVIRLESRNKFIKRGNFIYCRNSNETVVYIRKDINAEDFDSAFADCVTCMIAAKLAFANRDTQMASYFEQQLRERIANAKSIDSIENVHDFQPGSFNSKFLNARR